MTIQRKDNSIDLYRRAERLKSDTSARLDKLLSNSVLFQYKTGQISTTGLSLSRSNGLTIHIEIGDSYKIVVDNSISYIELDRMSDEKTLLADIGRLLSDTILIRKIKTIMDSFIEESIRLNEEIAQLEQNISNRLRADNDVESRLSVTNKEKLMMMSELQCSKVVVKAYEIGSIDTGLIARDKPIEIVNFYDNDYIAYSDVVRLNSRAPKKAQYSYMDVNKEEIELA